MITENVVHIADFAKPASTPLVCTKCGAPGEMHCGCGVAFAREVNATSKAEQAAEALRDPANANKSDRVIAEELGIDHKTVGAARRSTGENSPVGEKRVGRDGKERRAPKKPPSPKTDKAREVVHDAIESGASLTQGELADEAGVSTASIKFALHYQQGREEGIAWARANPEIDTDTLPKSAKEKLDAAIRQEKRRLEAEYEQKRRAEVEAHIKRIAPQLEEEQLEASRLQVQYREMIREKAIFTADEYKIIVMCLHPDNSASAETRGEGFRIFINKKLQLTGKE